MDLARSKFELQKHLILEELPAVQSDPPTKNNKKIRKPDDIPRRSTAS
jgi:hypothetical protein